MSPVLAAPLSDLAGVADPGYSAAMPSDPHKHLRRLGRVFIRDPVYFITTCTAKRAPVLAADIPHRTCIEVWENSRRLYGWHVGRYVLMPDHVHFFCRPEIGANPLKVFIGKWKEWTAKSLRDRIGAAMPLWQEEFFDHALRSHESYREKWEYVWQNPVRAGLVDQTEDWPYQGCLTELRVDEVETL